MKNDFQKAVEGQHFLKMIDELRRFYNPQIIVNGKEWSKIEEPGIETRTEPSVRLLMHYERG
jgi:hypothetical protein